MSGKQLIIVTNNGPEFRTKYDGTEYVFKTGESVPLSLEAARHIFGFGVDNKAEVLARHGWMSLSTEYAEALKHLDRFKFELGTLAIVPNTPALEVQEQASPEQPKPGSGAEAAGEATEQGSAPLQPDAGGGAKVTDGTEAKPPASTQQQEAPTGLMTDELSA